MERVSKVFVWTGEDFETFCLDGSGFRKLFPLLGEGELPVPELGFILTIMVTANKYLNAVHYVFI